MQVKTDDNWPRFVRTPEAARLLDLSPRTLEKHRCDGTGPIYRKLGGRVVYSIADLQAWVDGSARQSTSEALRGRPLQGPAGDLAANAAR
ncbi:helix-turn-helix domain-containing protein [Rhizobium sp. LC145]|uniref:helix-turn-helix transcriptional regulator n=1 Tax=Rhizobium sp. LC145 TaxID=1120688 RepID=UPI00062A2AB2|nr:helix-turn-helix domain-containing protein [Rhizobium sp. LC145]KKX29404.1 transcriptional regulator [Rhizobium sp. LC145]MDX3927938.1 helix-turn-helix domain-containing protein [Shinella sp.]TKT69018.1 helix-turn-helix domain-containing protein [Rhizobiaceae bacterium LC148]